MSCDYQCAVSLPRGAVGWSAGCDCDISQVIFTHLLFIIVKKMTNPVNSYKKGSVKRLFFKLTR